MDYTVQPAQLTYFRAIPTWTMWVDPGETCGFAQTTNGPLAASLGASYTQFFEAGTADPDYTQDAFRYFTQSAIRQGMRACLVIEEYRVYSDKVAIHIGKEVITSEIIGGFLLDARRAGVHVVKQASQVKQPIVAMLRDRGIEVIGGSQHIRDAQLHMWYSTLRNIDKQNRSKR